MSADDLSKKIKELRIAQGLTLEQVGNYVGVGKSTVRKWETGAIANMRRDKVAKLAEALHTTPAYLMGWPQSEDEGSLASNLAPLPKTRLIPLVGSIACGTPITAEQNIDGYVPVEEDLQCQFALKCKGDSMLPRVIDGDLVYIRQQPDVNDGQIAAVLIDGEATLKHVYHIPNGVQLVSDNPAYAPLIYTGDACAELRIVGLAVAYQRKLI